LSGEIDVGFTRSVPAEAKHLIKFELLFREPVVAVIPIDNPLAKEEKIRVARLASEDLVLYSREAGPDIFDPIIAMCRRAKFTPRVVATAGTWQSVLTLVEAGEGISVIPACVRQLRSNDVVFRPLDSGACFLDAIVAWRREESNALRETMLATLREKRNRRPQRENKKNGLNARGVTKRRPEISIRVRRTL
jgi:DNA-binding transcriptional LysR family regulator